MNRIIIYIICINLWLILCGCESTGKNRRIAYILKHPELTEEQKDLILLGRLWVGMLPSEVKASLGEPDIVQRDILGHKQVWSYIYRDQFTTHRRYAFNRVLRLEFIEGRLANWRED